MTRIGLFLLIASGVFAGLLLCFALKAGLQWYGCKAGKFSDDYCVYSVLTK